MLLNFRTVPTGWYFLFLDRVVFFVSYCITILSKIVSEVLFIFILLLDRVVLMRNANVVLIHCGVTIPLLEGSFAGHVERLQLLMVRRNEMKNNNKNATLSEQFQCQISID